jgi:hypothetical protein
MPYGRHPTAVDSQLGSGTIPPSWDLDIFCCGACASPHLPRVHDGTGDSGLAMHRPGFRVSDAPLSDALQRAYDAYEHELTTARRRGAGKEDVVPDAPKA